MASQVALVIESTCQCRRRRKCGFHPWVRKIPWNRKWQPSPVFLPGESHGQKELGGLQSMGSQRVGQGLVVETILSSGMHYKFDITAHSLYKADSWDTERTVIQFVVGIKDSNPCVFCCWWCLATPQGLWDLPSPTRDWTCTVGSESVES